MTSTERPKALTDEEILKRACELKGHTFVSDGTVLDSLPPQYPEFCKYCGARRVGIPQSPMRYYTP